VTFFLSALVTVEACALGRKGSAALEPALVLEVRNRSYFEVNIYALPSLGSSRVRIGTAQSFASSALTVPRSARRAGGSLVLELHAIGSNSSWVTPELQLFEGAVACLEIDATASGVLSRSMLYSATAPDSPGTAACGLMRSAMRHRDPRVAALAVDVASH
jgi:hypothetical protein